MAGGSKKFGVDAALVPALYSRIRSEGICDLRGLHTYAGTQWFDARAWAENARGLLAFANGLERECGIPVLTLDFGGGFGVPMYGGDPEFDLALVGAALQDLIAEDARPDRTYLVELGRYLVASAGVYLARVVYEKESGGQRHLVLDGGMHHHAAAAGLGALIRRPYPIVLARDPGSPPTQKVTLGGPLCTPADEFAAGLALPPATEGDVIAILASGAYGLTFSNTLFLSHPAPCEILVSGQDAWLVRERGAPEDALRGQHLPKVEEPAAP
jgi:diaminopimelate decarboxylase